MGQGWPKIIFGGKMGKCINFFFFGCSLEMFEGNDYLYLEGKWATIVCIWRANGLRKVGITKKKKT